MENVVCAVVHVRRNNCQDHRLSSLSLSLPRSRGERRVVSGSDREGRWVVGRGERPEGRKSS